MKKLDKFKNSNAILPLAIKQIQIPAQAAPRGQRLKDQNANLKKNQKKLLTRKKKGNY